MDEELLERLRQLMGARDATATRAMPRQPTIGPAPSAASQSRMPAPRKGLLAAIQRSAEPSEDTPAGMANEMLNPIRAGAQARELMGEAAGAVKRGNLGRAAGMGALAAMAVPGGPFHGSPAKGIRRLNPSPRGLFATDNPELAQLYTQQRGLWSGRPTGEVYELGWNVDNPLVIDAAGAQWSNIPVPWQPYRPSSFGNVPSGAVSTNDILPRAVEQGYGGVEVRNVFDRPSIGSQGYRSNVFIARDPNQVEVIRAIPDEELQALAEMFRRSQRRKQ